MQHCHNLMPLCMHNAVNPTRSPDRAQNGNASRASHAMVTGLAASGPTARKISLDPSFCRETETDIPPSSTGVAVRLFFFIFFVARCSGTEWLRLISLYSYSIISTPWLASGGLFTPSLTVSCALTNLDSCTPCSSPAHQCIQFMTNPVALHSRTLSLSS